MSTSHIISTVILAGGEGKRVGRQNKGLLTLKTIPLIQHVIHVLKPQINHLLISANRDLPLYQQYGYPVISDLPEWENKGPLSGIISTMSAIPKETDAVLVVPCDTPFLPSHLVATLENSLYNTNHLYDIAYAVTPDRIHPSIFLYKPHINQYLADHLNQHHYSLKSWIFRHQHTKTLFTDEHAFTNMNDMDTLYQNE